ncbi:MAG: septum formation initiator family protein [Alphaproteobacteria bacterium]|nr:septum formation initiator family protein [Alphaproteobacteria bacterium]MDX5369335.1 septum formation initiator family protein [Alphaproteobacteria bacterium]MDX5464016.1 septum formation initiator family protein [Alphaproteobacteria bacterium]
MAVLAEIRGRTGWAIWPIVLFAILAYFVYHGLEGERGLIAYLRLQYQVAHLEQELALARDEREAIERRIQLMGSGNNPIDPDLLEEQVHRRLGLANPNDVIILRGGSAE